MAKLVRWSHSHMASSSVSFTRIHPRVDQSPKPPAQGVQFDFILLEQKYEKMLSVQVNTPGQNWPGCQPYALHNLLSAVGSQKLQVVSEPFSTSCRNTIVWQLELND